MRTVGYIGAFLGGIPWQKSRVVPMQGKCRVVWKLDKEDKAR